jgi:hypothetical protein
MNAGCIQALVNWYLLRERCYRHAPDQRCAIPRDFRRMEPKVASSIELARLMPSRVRARSSHLSTVRLEHARKHLFFGRTG